MSKKRSDLAELIGADAEWRKPLSETLALACTEVKRRIALGNEADGLSTIELIGLIKTIGAINVEAGALLGDAEAAAD